VQQIGGVHGEYLTLQSLLYKNMHCTTPHDINIDKIGHGGHSLRKKFTQLAIKKQEEQLIYDNNTKNTRK